MLIYGLIGEKLSHSFSPILHDIIFKKCNLEGKYGLYEVEKLKLKDTIEKLRQSKIRGFNVTIPYKVEVIKYIDEISPEAKLMGAVNTLDFKDGKIIGYNTDYYGFGAALKNESIEIRGKKVLILGTGGASKSVYHYLKDNGIGDIIFASRNPKESKDRYPHANIINYSDLKDLKNMDIIINTTPVGMDPNVGTSPVDKNIIIKFKIAVDLIYNPIETEFLRLANAVGLQTTNGLYMLIGQGIKAQEIWNQVEFDQAFYNIIYKEVLEYVK